MSAWDVFGAMFLGGFALLCILGVVCLKRDAREPSRADEERHRPARAYRRGEVIKP